MGKSTEDTAMELDGEGAANFEQLQDLIRKECDKCDRKYARLEEKCNKLEQQVEKTSQIQNQNHLTSMKGILWYVTRKLEGIFDGILMEFRMRISEDKNQIKKSMYIPQFLSSGLYGR